ncbi:unnamed protein product [Rotaria sp. Silwood1]|nr:unnamed protein product [Rotaria sp. Silwood1]CAF3524792.1 unnamed protein product [Rotaria sp. Silwood1]CAF3586737.1 unnamed protein product [Rotaria sp. Silwood1]CAF4698151.1 unnamed protein product [Rotaria sp. Silwood1]CAF4877011.1 unnamed protein product [Rotaria sp. Silwood1]
MTSLSTEELIIFISEQYTIYVSFIILFSGIFGHMAIIFVLTRLKIFRRNPSAFYLIAESIVDLLQMIISFTSRIAINGFVNDLTQTSLIWCKLRSLFVQSFTLISLSIVCFAAIDQYLSTNYYPFLRQKSTMKLAKNFIIIATIIWILHGVPVLFFFEIQSTYGCNIYNENFRNYVTYVYYLIFTGTLPIIISTLFSVLAYRNVRRIVRRQIPLRRRKFDQQLTAMILVRVGFLVIITLPYVLQRIYSLTTLIVDDSSMRKSIEQFIEAFAYSLFYLNYSGSFYLFLISSTRFRRQVKHVFINKCWRMYYKKTLRRNQIATITQSSSCEYDVQSVE